MISAPKEVDGPGLFRLFADELGTDRVLRVLRIHPSTLKRWMRGSAPIPRSAVLALYWESSYGRSLVEVDHHNEMQLMRTRIALLEDQLVKAKDIITGLRRMIRETANEPLFDDLGEMHALTQTPGAFAAHLVPDDAERAAHLSATACGGSDVSASTEARPTSKFKKASALAGGQ